MFLFAAKKSVLRDILCSLVALCLAAQGAVAQTPIKVTSYSYDGKTLSGKITLYNYAYAKTVTINYADLAASWSYSCAATYSTGPDSSNYEYWVFGCSIGSAGISQFYATYVAAGTTYYDNNGGYGVNYKVTQPTATTTVKPVTTTITTNVIGTTTANTPRTTTTILPGTKPVAFSSDISNWLAVAVTQAQSYLLANIHPSGTLAGVVVAAPKVQPSSQNYFFHWIRDASLVMD
ncbi:glycoside hydrolase 15 protein, partial [Gonapodya sp. JEL0774]